jgi:hypothetical protein
VLINRTDVPAPLLADIDYEIQRLGLDIYINTQTMPPDDAPIGNAIELWWPRSGDRADIAFRAGDATVVYSGPWHSVRGDYALRATLNDDGYAPLIATVRGRRVLLAFEPSRLASTPWRDADDNELAGNPLGRVLGDVFAECLPRAADAALDTRPWVTTKLAALDCRVQRVRQEMSTNQHRLWELERELHSVLTKISEQRELIELLDGDVAALRRGKAREEAADLGRLVPHAFERIASKGEALKARTSPLHIAWDGYTYAFGRFDVVVHLPSGTVTAVPVDDGFTRQGYPHPHLDTEGNPCWGNMARPVKEALASGHVVEALTTIRTFLSHYNPDNPYLSISRWGEDDVDEEAERFERCYESADPFGDCITCADSDCPYWDDRHERCWEAGSWSSLRDCVGCGRCDHATDAVDDCRSDHEDGGCVSCRVDDCRYQGQGPDANDESEEPEAEGEELVQLGAR